ncbi:MAG: helix-turn-helix domain-containing protein [Clostridia bacterium]|nr:helix-turn-helix domain-containing protein [Clostridia bacterium]
MRRRERNIRYNAIQKDRTVVTTDVPVKICVALNCEIGNIVEIVPDENA